MNYFEDFIGQNRVKRKLSFYIESFKSTSTLPFLSFVGSKGLGKTAFARAASTHLISNGVKRPFIEINSSTIKNLRQFIDQIYIPKIFDQDVSLLFDEAHMLPKTLVNAFLTILNAENSHIRNFIYEDASHEFNFRRQSFMFATTESQALFAPLKDRLTSVNFADYQKDDLEKIIQKNLPKVSFEGESLAQLADASRGNPRGCVKISKEVERYMATYKKRAFSSKDMSRLSFEIDLLPHGLTSIERQILQTLRSIGSCSLTMLAARTGLSKCAIQKDHELYLLKKGFLGIEQHRYITKDGADAIDYINRAGL
jgi:Holliday junction resolvasome RuvABC ATP-dependent DNA helicase subunit